MKVTCDQIRLILLRTHILSVLRISNFICKLLRRRKKKMHTATKFTECKFKNKIDNKRKKNKQTNKEEEEEEERGEEEGELL